MAELVVGGGMLTVEIHGADRLWSLHHRLEVPLAHVAGARVDPPAVREAIGTGIKWGGTRVGDFVAGTFRQQGQWVFWDVHHPDRAVIVELHDEEYARLVVEVEDPAGAAAAVNRAVAGGG